MERLPSRTGWLALLAGALLLAGAHAGAASLQVAPTTVTVAAGRNAEGLVLGNTGDAVLHAQARVFRWTRVEGEDALEPTSDLAVSPPMLQVPAGGEQLVRVVRLGPAPEATEASYRVIVDELPLDSGEDGHGLHFVLRYSIPVFLAPAGGDASPRLSAARSPDGRSFTIGNSGSGHAQVSDMAKRFPARWVRSASCAALAATLSCPFAARPAPPPTSPGTGDAAAPMRLYLDVVLNRTPHPQLVEFELHADGLHASAATLRSLGFHLPARADPDMLPLASIPGVLAAYDAGRQRVEITAPLDALALDTTRPSISEVIEFGTVTAGEPVPTTASIDYECTTQVPLFSASTAHVRMCFAIGAGTAPGSTVATRLLSPASPGGSPMAVQLYRDAGRSQIWGDAPAGGITWHTVEVQYPIESFIGIGGRGQHRGTIPVHGHIPAQLPAAPGDYSAAFPDSRLLYRYTDSWFGPAPASCQSSGTGGDTEPFSFTAHARVPSTCTVAAGSLDFGRIAGLIDAPHDRTSAIDLTCTPGTAYQVGLDRGLHAAGAGRRLAGPDGGWHLHYELYRDPARTLPWGATLDLDTLRGTGTGAPQQLIVHGRIPAGQAVPAGRYHDIVTVTVSY